MNLYTIWGQESTPPLQHCLPCAEIKILQLSLQCPPAIAGVGWDIRISFVFIALALARCDIGVQISVRQSVRPSVNNHVEVRFSLHL